MEMKVKTKEIVPSEERVGARARSYEVNIELVPQSNLEEKAVEMLKFSDDFLSFKAESPEEIKKRVEARRNIIKREVPDALKRAEVENQVVGVTFFEIPTPLV